MISIIKGIEKYFQEILISSLVFYLFKTAFWPLTYFCIAGYILVLIIYFSRLSWKMHIKEFLTEYLSPVILSLIILLCSIYKGYYRNEIVQKDLIRLAILFSYFYFLHWNTKYLKQELPLMFGIRLVIYTTVFISVINLIKNLVIGFIPTEVMNHLKISYDMALASDYNFFSLFLLLGLVTLNYRDNAAKRLGFSFLAIHAFNIVVGINILISGSRRGIIAFLILIIVYLVNKWISQKKTLSRLYKVSSFIFGILLLLFLAGIIIYNTTSQDKITNSVLRYGSFFGINDKVKIERFLWKKKLQNSITGNYIISKDFFKRNPGSGFLWNQQEPLFQV